MRIEYKEKFYNAEYPDGYTYVGIYIYLYGCNDVVVDYLYLNYLNKWKRRNEHYTKNLYEELLVHKKELSRLTSNEKLRVLASSRFGRRDLQRFAVPKNNLHFAGIDYDNNERLVPDWYINHDGPVSDYRSGNIMYSEYSNKPLDHKERLKRYHGILQQKKTITQMTAETLQRGVRRLFNLSRRPVANPLPEVVAVLADPPPPPPPPPLPELEEDYNSSLTDALLEPTTKPTKLTALDRLDALRADPLTKNLDLALPYKSRKGKSATASIETEERNLLHLLDALMMEDEPKVKPSRATSPKVEPPRATSPKVDLPKVEPLRAASPKVETPKAEAAELETLLSGDELKKEILSKPKDKPKDALPTYTEDIDKGKPQAAKEIVVEAAKEIAEESDNESDEEPVKSKPTPPAYTVEDEVRGKQQSVNDILNESIVSDVLSEDETELNEIIQKLPKNIKAELKNVYKQFEPPLTYNKTQLVVANRKIYDTYEDINKLRKLNAEDMKQMAGTQYGMEGLLTMAKQYLSDLSADLVVSGISEESAKKVNNNIIKTLLAAGRRDVDKYGDSIAKSKPKSSKHGPPTKMLFESFEDLILK